MILKKINLITQFGLSKKVKSFGDKQRKISSRLPNIPNLTKHITIKSQIKGLKKHGGRNNFGNITSFRKSGGHKKSYRIIDFYRANLQGIISSVEYDPNRTAHIASVFDLNKKKHSYIILPKGLQKGNLIKSGDSASIKVGHSLLLDKVPLGSYIHNISLIPKGKGQIARAAGSYAQLIQKTEHYARIKLRSGKQRLLSLNCTATLGIVSNETHSVTPIEKAGRSRWLGKKPIVRGVAMNPVDHPHGGGEGKTSGGRPSVTPWGKPTKGQSTRRLNKNLIVPQTA
jgi:large subunit ribosomal protein L2